MENVHYVAVKVSSYDPENGFKEWYELQAQPNEDEIFINLESLNEQDR